MEYKKVKIEYISDELQESREKLKSILNEYGIYEFELIDEFKENELDYNENFKFYSKTWNIIFYLLDNKYFSKKIDMILESINKHEEITYDVSISSYNDATYKDEWKKYFKTTRIHKNIVIKPSWDECEVNDSDIVIDIDPGIAFGTGTHETTSLCLNMMYDELKHRNDLDNINLIDIGCGSGILMLLASKMGLNDVTGIDIDPKVKEVVKENFYKNNINKYEVKILNLIDNINQKYDVIVSNILVDVLENLIVDIKKICHLSSTLIFSGILTEKLDGFIAKCQDLGFYVVKTLNKNEWSSVMLKLKPKNVIAIDGPAGSGKSTIAIKISEKLGYNYLNTGSMYRSYAYKLLKENANLNKDLLKYVDNLDLKVKNNKFILDDEDITDKIRDEEVGNIASTIVSVNGKIRKYLVNLQRILAKDNSVLDGRDIGSIVFPEAKLKIFLIASPEIRAERRFKELKEKGQDIEYNKILEDIKTRDISDTTRNESPLMKTKEYVEIDTSNMTIDEIVDKIYDLAKEREMI